MKRRRRRHGYPYIFEQELRSLEEDQDINEFITELFNENNTLPKCELDQGLEDYLEEMEIQQQKGEQSQEVSDENYFFSFGYVSLL